MLILQMGLCKYVCLNVDWVKQTVGLKMAKNQEKESFESAKLFTSSRGAKDIMPLYFIQADISSVFNKQTTDL